MPCSRCGGSGVVPAFPRAGFGLNPGNRPTGYAPCSCARRPVQPREQSPPLKRTKVSRAQVAAVVRRIWGAS